ncbi:MAG: class I SAM-dependent methyltransferase [Candidatus Saccharibacteria bacterium]|nr:class I SAM-dependent methyltransferase [Candidatus Saccharibacteria bacterium]
MVKAKNVVSDYNGYDYKKIFWEDVDREYEDLADRMAIRRLLPTKMGRFVDVAGGYGRLAKEYLGRAKEAIIFDYSETELKQAREEFGKKIKTRQGDIYDMPFKDGEVDVLMMIRATHHFKDLDKVVNELSRVLKPGGVAVIEVANKKTLPRMVKYWTKKTDKNPFSLEPVNFTEICPNGFFNYHPKYVEDLFKKSGFEIEEKLSVSNFRSPKLKKMFSAKTLAAFEKKVQKPLAKINFAPSIYYKLVKK